MTRINLDRLLQCTFLVWISVITVRYATAVFQGLRTPISPGTDIEWLMLWTVAAVVVAILAAGFRNAPIFLPLLLAFACFVVLILSGNVFAGLVTLWIFAVAHGWGLRLLRLTGVEVDGLLESISLTIPLGLIVPALAGFLLAAAHALTPVSVWLLLITLTVPTVLWAGTSSPPQLRRGGAKRRGGVDQPMEFSDQDHRSLDRIVSALPSSAEEGSFSFAILIMVPVAFLNFLWAVAPEIQYDAANYHLTVGRIYLADSGFVNLPNFFHSYFFRLVEMLFTLGLAPGGPATTKFMSFGFGLIATCCVFVLGKLTVDSRTGAWAAALFYTTPIVNWLSGTADNDLAVAMFMTAALIAFLKFHGNDEAVGWLYITALLAGAAIATKVDAAFGLVPLFAVGFWKYRKAKTIVACALLLLAVSLPWYALDFLLDRKSGVSASEWRL